MQEGDGEAASRLWFRMLRLQTKMNFVVGRRLKRLGISIPQADVLMTLTEREGVSQQELAARLYVTKGNISGLVDRLAAAKFVERRKVEADRRSHAIFLTPAGRTLAAQALLTQHEFVARTIGRLTNKQILDFEALLLATRDLVRTSYDWPCSASRSRGGEERRRAASH
jgi:MarR family transcriptional regulator, organic hydroperoxide resistance regulator